MKFGGLQETSLLDYPEKISAIVWTVGCNYRCPFCYNPSMVFGTTDVVSEDTILSFLDTRIGKLDALSITGGEPLMHDDIGSFIKKVKEKGFLVKIDTNGSFPKHLRGLLDHDLIDYVSMDIKAPPEKYDDLAGVHVPIKKINESIRLIMNKAIDYEFKTTVVPKLLEKKDITSLARWIQGAQRYYLQQFKMDVPVINEKLRSTLTPYQKTDFEAMKTLASKYVQTCSIRGISSG